MRFKNLERFKTGGAGNTMLLSIPLPKTPDGRTYRYSPNECAHPRHFLLGDRIDSFILPQTPTPRMTHAPGTPGTTCPYSGVRADDNDFTHPDDIAAAREVVAHAVHNDVSEALHEMFAGLARNHSNSKYLQIKTGPRPSPKPAPRFGRTDLLRELVCDECGRDYGVYAISLFCPDCGAPNIHLHFAREVTLVREQVQIAANLVVHQSELAYRLMGNAHEDVLTAFEAMLKTVYLHKVESQPDGVEIKSVGNAFQNIERARKRFAEFGFDPFACLTTETLAVLALNIQKRHVIGHNLGIADASFAEYAAEARLGETVSLVGDDILQFAEIGQMVVNGIDGWLANGAPPAGPETLPTKAIVAPVAKQPTVLEIGELTPLAVRIGLWISEHSAKGFDDFIPEEAVTDAFPDASGDELAFAVMELSKDGYLDTTSYSVKRLPRMRATVELYITFDPHAVKTDPVVDVVVLVERVLASRDTVAAHELH